MEFWSVELNRARIKQVLILRIFPGDLSTDPFSWEAGKRDMSTLHTDLHRSMGICLGASTISTVEKVNGEITSTRTNHGGKVSEVVKELIHNTIPAKVGITGRKFRDLINIETVSEPEAVELAYDHIRPQYAGMDSILSAGSESFLVYALDHRGRIRSVSSGNKCASGTGEFFLQQIKRMDLDVDDAVKIAASFEPHEIATRCSVFSKSDCTHALNKGVEKGRVAAGLCMMMAGKMIELLRAVKAKRIMVVGGVSQNQVVMRFLKEVYPEILIPEEAPYFEALGAMLWAEQNGCLTEKREDLVKTSFNSFPTLPKLQNGKSKVKFKSAPKGQFHNGDYIVGLDVGSTTTKAVLIRTDNQAIVANEYLRTLGDPVRASRKCYRTLLDRIPDGIHPNIVGLGITGSGRQIAGLHALTEGTINEIMAHAAAAVYFDPEVDTIFEIGGQDAKYTSITNRVPTDYAMNEACSAGTGSFLEEACMESFGIETSRIAQAALASQTPPNFSDQCAAFIGSDIKTAVQEGASREDSVAGLVYSVCQNYLNRVKGNRLVGKKVFMQGGVCYNHAVPLAMATLCDREIIVPPEPGLMGAFGAAIEVQRKINSGLIEKRFIDLAELASREVKPAEPFICNGGREVCDRRCQIDRYLINERTYPFGGACNRYYNASGSKNVDREGFDMVRTREDQIYKNPPTRSGNSNSRTVGILSSLYTN
ncbi:activase, partial [bacterium]